MWSYGMSSTMTIYRTCDLAILLNKLEFTNPNEMEDGMVACPINKPFIISCDEIKVVELSINIVSISSYQYSKYGVGDLNTKWLTGLCIDKEKLNNLREDTFTFYNAPIEFKNRKNKGKLWNIVI